MKKLDVFIIATIIAPIIYFFYNFYYNGDSNSKKSCLERLLINVKELNSHCR